MCENVVRHCMPLGLRAERALAPLALAPLRLLAEVMKWAYVAVR